MAEMSVAEMSVGRNVRGQNVRGRNVLAETSVAEMSVAEMSEHLFGVFAMPAFSGIYHWNLPAGQYLSQPWNRHKFQDVACQGNLKFCQGIVRGMSGNFVSAGVWQPCLE